MQVGNYYTGISTSCSACTSVGTVSGNASQVTYTMDTQNINISSQHKNQGADLVKKKPGK